MQHQNSTPPRRRRGRPPTQQATGKRKVTLLLAGEILDRALTATGWGLSATVERGLELVAASRAFEAVRSLRGKVRFSIDLKKLRQD